MDRAERVPNCILMVGQVSDMSLRLSSAMHRRISTILWQSARTYTRTMPGLHPSITHETQRLSDPTLLEKFRCHPTIPCGIPQSGEDLNAFSHHVPDHLLPTNWSSNWLEFQNENWFVPCLFTTYSMGCLDIVLKTIFRIPYPIRPVMYCTVEWPAKGGLFEQEECPGNHEAVIFQDGLGDYNFYYEFSQGGSEYLAKFRAPRGTTVNDFVKDHFRGAVKGVDMDVVSPGPFESYAMLLKEEENLAELREQARAKSPCACWTRHQQRTCGLIRS